MITFHDVMYVFGAALPYVQHAKAAVDGVSFDTPGFRTRFLNIRSSFPRT